MLKHRININEIRNEAVDLSVSNIKITDIVDGDDLLSSTKVVVCTYDDNVDLQNINEVIGINEYTLVINNDTADSLTLTPNDYKETTLINSYNISNSVNSVLGTFSFSIPYLCNFTIKDMVYNDYDVERPYVTITFTTPHYYTAVKPNVDDDNNDNTIYLWKYITVSMNNAYYVLGTETEFRDYEDDVFKRISRVDIVTSNMFRFEIKDNVRANDFFLMEISDNGEEIVKEHVPTLRFYRPNFLFSNWGTPQFFFYDNKCKLNIPLSSVQQTNLNKEDILNNYVEEARRRSINKTVDMEKDIYYPVLLNNDGTYEDVYKIKFNFHFVARDDENWISETKNLWNGVEVDDEQKLSLSEDFFSYNDKSSQSDLLSYLNFTNSDVRYQKNRLKKSFVRLSFYDSPNMGNQNLLSYSTIFMNGGEYFVKYVKYMEVKEPKYKSVTYKILKNGENFDWNSVNFDIENDLNGIKVNREPVLPLSVADDEREEKRLSSQITVTDKYNSDASSEGFYLYLWKDILPVDELGKKGVHTVYMKVEFNHAGFGRVIPFMMPYWDNKKWNKRDIKTFEEIVDDWAEKDNTDGRYGAKQYSKFSYIKIKIGYDENNKKYIYYLDDDVYGNPNFTNNELTFNLYEAKMV